MTLPAGDAQVTPLTDDVHGELSAAERRRLASLRVLYVEDDLEIMQAGAEMLSMLGVVVLACSNFDEAATHVGGDGFDVLLTDLDLGGGRSGLELMPLMQRSSGNREAGTGDLGLRQARGPRQVEESRVRGSPREAGRRRDARPCAAGNNQRHESTARTPAVGATPRATCPGRSALRAAGPAIDAPARPGEAAPVPLQAGTASAKRGNLGQ